MQLKKLMESMENVQLIEKDNGKEVKIKSLNTDSRKILQQLIDERYQTYALADIVVETKDEILRKTLGNVLSAIEEYSNK